jgi:hypothetical protein
MIDAMLGYNDTSECLQLVMRDRQLMSA